MREPRAYVFHVVTNLCRDTYHARVRAAAYARDAGNAPGVAAAPDHSVLDAIGRLRRLETAAADNSQVSLALYGGTAVPDIIGWLVAERSAPRP